MKARSFHLVIEVDEDGNLVSSVPELLGLHAKGRTVEQVERRTDAAIAALTEVEPPGGSRLQFRDGHALLD
jgi:predicted RNase H-like HicB family nuclease